MIRPKKWKILGGGLAVVLVATAAAAAKHRQKIEQDAARAEAKAILSTVMLAEETYRSEHEEYFDVSGGSTAMHPRSRPTPDAVAWDKETSISRRFNYLMTCEGRCRPDQNLWHGERVRFVYTVFAGRGAAPKDKLPRAVHHWLPFKHDPGYIALAVGDPDGDGEMQYLAASSEHHRVVVLNDD